MLRRFSCRLNNLQPVQERWKGKFGRCRLGDNEIMK
jgi:hypothetical protein